VLSLGAANAGGSLPSIGWVDVVKYSPRPYSADEGDLDEEEYRVIRASDGRPLAYIEKSMWKEDQDFLSKLFVRSADLLELMKMLREAAVSTTHNGPILSKREWTTWRSKAEELHRDIWGQDQEEDGENEQADV
jgi:hypothetical protein